MKCIVAGLVALTLFAGTAHAEDDLLSAIWTDTLVFPELMPAAIDILGKIEKDGTPATCQTCAKEWQAARAKAKAAGEKRDLQERAASFKKAIATELVIRPLFTRLNDAKIPVQWNRGAVFMTVQLTEHNLEYVFVLTPHYPIDGKWTLTNPSSKTRMTADFASADKLVEYLADCLLQIGVTLQKGARP